MIIAIFGVYKKYKYLLFIAAEYRTLFALIRTLVFFHSFLHKLSAYTYIYI